MKRYNHDEQTPDDEMEKLCTVRQIEVKCEDCDQPFVALALGGIRQRICADCSRKRKADEAVHIRFLREREWGWLCPAEFRLTTEDGGETNIAQMDAKNPDWRQVLSWEYGRKGLIVRGETRTCKTRAVWRLLHRLMVDEGRSVQAYTANQFDTKCKEVAASFTESEWIDQMTRVGVFFLDDLGKANWTMNTETMFSKVLDSRLSAVKPILYTTNYDRETLTKRLSTDAAVTIIPRLLEVTEKMVFKGVSCE